MRYLNKIVFINSAHIPYAEIKLDGNVHFIGTQGVGKSTLLRAILFFYNVDKSKLGIKTQAGQKSYDEFYLPNPDSYIIYEICRETGTFFVVSFLSGGRAAFRIIDCAFDKKFFIEDDGSVLYEWGKISDRIGKKVYKSNTIRNYEEFRDIIYGNTQNVDKELRRFCILESSKYQNVPRTIQNVFLNQSLESRVIKDTIIDSMDFMDDNIDLNFYREHLKKFRQQYEDIWKWFKVEKNGKIKVRTDADNVIEKYRLYEYCRTVIVEGCGKLKFALERDKNRLPELSNKEAETETQLSRQKRLLSEENDKYTKQRDEIKGELAVNKKFFDDLKTKRNHYDNIDIKTIESKILAENALKISQQTLRNQEIALTDKNRDVKAKYDEMQKNLDNELRELELQSESTKIEIEKVFTENISKLQSEMSAKKDDILSQFQERNDELQHTIIQANSEKNNLEKKALSIKQMNPFSAETSELEKEIKKLSEREKELTQKASEINGKIDKIRHENELSRKDLENNCETEIQQIEFEIETLQKAISECDELINRQHGSLIEWLSSNAPDWKENIGKVMDENVLYNTTLNPRYQDNNKTIFGVGIDLDNLELNTRTPEEILSQRADLEQKKANLHNKIAGRRQQLAADIEALNRKPNAQLKALKIEKINTDTELEQCPLRIKDAEKKLSDFNDKITEFRTTELSKIEAELNKTEALLTDLNNQKSTLDTKKNLDLETMKKDYEKRKKSLEKEKDAKVTSLKTELEKNAKHNAAKKWEILAIMDAELKGLGVDTEKLSKIRVEIENIETELKFIDSHRKDYFEWQNDVKDFFSKENFRKDERQKLTQKLNDLEQKFIIRREKLDNEIKYLSGELTDLKSSQTSINEAIEKVNNFLINSSCPNEMPSCGEIETTEKILSILEKLRDDIADRLQKLDAFRGAVNTFKKNFSAQNTFDFRTEFNVDTDYIEFAVELNEFVSNNKIEEYRLRTSSTYADIIQRIAKEVGDLKEHEANIRKTIISINDDFENNNFAGVIKKIALRADESNDRLMQQLLNIKKFSDDNNLNIGELNLFSSQDTINKTNEQAVKLLMTFIDYLDAEQKREKITLSDTFKLQFKVKENDNEIEWTEKLTNVGSDGTDILVKAMVNIMLINVFKKKISKKFGDFKLHCMMDEIGKLHPDNVAGILKFANVRNVYLINSSPTTYNAQAYKYTYSLSKDSKSNTVVKTLLTIR